MNDWSRTRTRHGTHSGWALHTALGERPCDPCYRAKQAYSAARNGQMPQTLLNRAYARAQGKAEKELKHRHPDEYRDLYEAFRDADLRDMLTEGAA